MIINYSLLPAGEFTSSVLQSKFGKPKQIFLPEMILQRVNELIKQFTNFCFLIAFLAGQIKIFRGWQSQCPEFWIFTTAAPAMGEIYPFILCSQVQDCG